MTARTEISSFKRELLQGTLVTSPLSVAVCAPVLHTRTAQFPQLFQLHGARTDSEHSRKEETRSCLRRAIHSDDIPYKFNLKLADL